MSTQNAPEPNDRRRFLHRLGRGAVVMLLGLAGTTGAASRAATQEHAAKSEGCCQACCPEGCCPDDCC